MQIEEAIEKIQELLNLTNWYPKYGYKEAIVTTLNYIDIMQSEFDRLEGIEDNTAMLKMELEKKEAIINEMAEYMEQEMYEYQLDDIYSELHNCNGMERNWTRGKEVEIKDIKEYFTKKTEEK